MTEPLVSVIITTFGRSGLIGEAVSQVLRQTYQPLEIIVVDDNGAGTDEQLKTREAIGVEIESGRVNYHAPASNQGAQLARNYGAAVASGEWLAFFDDDDRWNPDKIRLQAEVAMIHPDAGMIYCFQQARNAVDGKVLFETTRSFGEGNIYRNLLHLESGTLATPNPLIRRAAFADAGQFDPVQEAAQDIDLFLRIARKYPAWLVPQILHIALVHPRERISTNHRRKLNGFRSLLAKFEPDMSLATRQHIYSRMLFHAFWLNSLPEAREAYVWLLGAGRLTPKYRLFYWGCRCRMLRVAIGFYFKQINN